MTLKRDQRSAILELHKQGVDSRQIAKMLKILRRQVVMVIRMNSLPVRASRA